LLQGRDRVGLTVDVDVAELGPLGFEEALRPLAVRAPGRAVDGQFGHGGAGTGRAGEGLGTLTCNTNRATRSPGSGNARAPRPWPLRRPCRWSRDRRFFSATASDARVTRRGRRGRWGRLRAWLRP